MPHLWGIDHPNFIHLSPTHYKVFSPDYEFPAMIHIEHLANLLGFNAAIRARGGLMDLTTIPLGFTEFALAWNTGVHANDPQHISEVFLSTKHQDSVTSTSSHPVHLSEFHITPEQCGLATTLAIDPSTSSAQADIKLEFASMFARQRQAQHHGFKDQRKKRLWPFNTGPAIHTKAHWSSSKHKSKSLATTTSTSMGQSSNVKLTTVTHKTSPAAKMETE